MHMETTTRPAPFGAIAAYGLVRLVAGLGESALAWHRARRTLRTLTRLSDRELDDIGLTRDDVLRAARGEFR